MLRYSLTIFLSAFLLFLVQPLVARRILPVYGGTAAVWTTCLVYFQVMLLLGYLYAHIHRVCLRPRTGLAVHLLLLLIACLYCGFHEVDNEVIDPEAGLAASVARRLTSVIGLPFLVLAATGPLIQAWHSLTHPHQQTYRLYALSNVGSLMALISYPFVFDQFLGLANQAEIWSLAFLLLVGLMCVSGWQMLRKDTWDVAGADKVESGLAAGIPRPSQLSVLVAVVSLCLFSASFND